MTFSNVVAAALVACWSRPVDCGAAGHGTAMEPAAFGGWHRIRNAARTAFAQPGSVCGPVARNEMVRRFEMAREANNLGGDIQRMTDLSDYRATDCFSDSPILAADG